MQIQIEVVKVSPPVNKGKYEQLEVAYKRDGKIEGKKLLSFKSEEVWNTIKDSKEGDSFTVTTEKDDKGYWQWTAVDSGGSVPVPATAVPATSQPVTGQRNASQPTTGRVVGSNYETADERRVKQRYIVRQSSITAALTFLTHNAPKAMIERKDVVEIARFFENYVFEKPGLFDDMQDDIPS